MERSSRLGLLGMIDSSGAGENPAEDEGTGRKGRG